MATKCLILALRRKETKLQNFIETSRCKMSGQCSSPRHKFYQRNGCYECSRFKRRFMAVFMDRAGNMDNRERREVNKRRKMHQRVQFPCVHTKCARRYCRPSIA